MSDSKLIKETRKLIKEIEELTSKNQERIKNLTKTTEQSFIDREALKKLYYGKYQKW